MNPGTDNLLLELAVVFAAYLTGSFSTAIISCKLLDLPDPRTTGSNNPGATNVLRAGGKKAGAITLLGDILKGLLPILIVSYFQFNNTMIAATGAATFLGHLFPLYYNFKGGKGVATFYGVLLGFHWLGGLSLLAIWGLAALLFRISSLAALISVFCAPFISWFFTRSIPLSACVLAMAILIYWRHRNNIRNLLNGNESKIGHKKSSATE